MIKIKISDSRVLGIGFEYRARELNPDEKRILATVDKVLGLTEEQALEVKRDITRTRLTATKCLIYEMKEGDEPKDVRLLCSHLEPCSDDDNFCKESGRKKSLTKLLTPGGHGDALFSKDVRTALWKGYLNRPRHVKKVVGEVVDPRSIPANMVCGV